MTNELAKYLDKSAMEALLVDGDLAVLAPDQRAQYYLGVCEGLGLNPTTKPFQYIRLNGKLTLYATKACTDQLRRLHKVSIGTPDIRSENGLFVVTVLATDSEGRTDSDMGVVAINGLGGESLSNAMMKAVTKAKRRVTLSLCGLGMLDESEVDSIAGAEPMNVEAAHHPQAPVAAREETFHVEHDDVWTYVEKVEERPGKRGPFWSVTFNEPTIGEDGPTGNRLSSSFTTFESAVADIASTCRRKKEAVAYRTKPSRDGKYQNLTSVESCEELKTGGKKKPAPPIDEDDIPF